MSKTAIRVPWLVPVTSPPIADAVIEIQGGVVRWMGRRQDYQAEIDRDYPDAALIPALVNAHTHLEFSDLERPLGRPGTPFADWILDVVSNRMDQTDAGKLKAIEKGFRESFECGVGALGEIATGPFRNPDSAPEQIEWVIFQELLGRDVKQLETRLGTLRNESDADGSWGLSPHAPYSVHDNLFESILARSSRTSEIVAMHLAETESELQLMEHGNGPFEKALVRLGAWYPESYKPFRSPRWYLERLAQVRRALVVHGNYLQNADLEFIAGKRNVLSLVYCPRTHHYFGHPRYPLIKALNFGVNVCVGTDSRASNPDLDLLQELQFIRVQFPEISPKAILKMGTENGATALGLETRATRLGGIEVGRRCALSLVSTNETMKSPYTFLDAESQCRRLLFPRGR